MTSREPVRRDQGNALIVAIMIVGVCMSLAIIGVQVAMSATRASGVDRQRLLAVNAAEAGVDGGYVAIQNGGLTPPCSISMGSVKSGPDTAQFDTNIRYFDAAGLPLTSGPGASPFDCTLESQPAQAVVRSTALTNTLGGGDSRGRRTMEALVKLLPVNNNALTKAIFANGALTFDNQTTITGNGGADADLYSNSSIDCSNNESFAGNVYSQGSITMSNKCTFAGDVWARGSVTTGAGSNGNIGGAVKSGTGLINMSGVNITGNLYAAGTIAYSSCSTPGRCYPNNSPGLPPAEVFPILRGDAAAMSAWEAGSPTVAPYTVITDNVCVGFMTRLYATYSQSGVNTLVKTTCPVSFGSDLAFRNNLAIYAYGGVTTGKATLSSSVAGTKRDIHFIVPYDAATALPCVAPVLDTDKQFDITNDIDLFLYSPCDISYRNASKHIGQIYGGSNVFIKNQFTMQFRPVDVFGIAPESAPLKSYNPSIVFKRETR